MEGVLCFNKDYLRCTYFLPMTRITKTGIYLDSKLYEELGSPGNLGYIFLYEEIYLFPTNSFLRVTSRNGRPFFSIPSKVRHFLKPGTFESIVTDKFGQMTYYI